MLTVLFWLAPLLYLWMFWGIYVMVMGFYRAHLAKKLSATAVAFALPFLVLGYAMDALANLTFASILFLEFPREWLVTTRLTRLMKGVGWRAEIAKWICANLLDIFDPNGTHCS